MTLNEKIQKVQILVQESDEATTELVTVLLEEAEDAIFQRMYPFGVPSTVTDVPAKYEILQCRLASRYFYRRGSEGLLSDSETGYSHKYGSVNDEDLLSEVMQKVIL